MALLTGIIICKNCNKEIKWNHQLAQPMHLPHFDVDTIPDNAVRLSHISQLQDNVYKAGVYCDRCDAYNEFNFTDAERIVERSKGKI